MQQLFLRCSVPICVGRTNSTNKANGSHDNKRKAHTLRSTLLIASTLVALASGTGIAAAQVADNPPGSSFQDQGIREDLGLPRTHSNATAAYGSYGYAQRRTVVNGNHRAVTRQQRDQWAD
jgi:hypothetical protein